MDELEAQIAQMERPDTWPMWPYLPLKKAGPSQELGYLYDPSRNGPAAYPDAPAVLRRGNVGNPSPEDLDVPYESLAQLVADGWRVD